MLAHLRQGTLVLRMGSHFGVHEAERLYETVLSFSPLSKLTLDFTAVREFQDATLGILARILGTRCAGHVEMRGLTSEQAQLLNYAGGE
jgi:hypothetical protein